MAAPVDVCNSFAAQFKHLPALRAGGHLQMRPAFKRWHVNLAAQSRNGKRDRYVTIQIVTFALKNLVLPNVYDHIKIARRTAASAGLPVASRAQPRTLPDSGGYFQLNAAQFLHASFAMALLTRFLNDFTSTAAPRTRLRNVKKSARTNHLPTAVTCRACNRARAWFSAATLAFVAGIEFRDFNLFLGAKRRLLQLDLHVVAQIGPAPSIFRAFPATEECLEYSAAESATAENFPKNLKRIVETAATETSAARGERRVAEAIVGGAFVRIHEDIVRFA